eukprot:4967580-Prymnesium_polylepis.1
MVHANTQRRRIQCAPCRSFAFGRRHEASGRAGARHSAHARPQDGRTALIWAALNNHKRAWAMLREHVEAHVDADRLNE